jgi:DNA invertase Pin-like site-specific DNA recombinase
VQKSQRPSHVKAVNEKTVKGKHVAVYVRVSTNAQDTRSQEPDLAGYVQAQSLCSVMYRDKYTGKSMDRPGWNSLMAAVYRGDVDRVVVWRLDRLGRTAKGLTALFDDLRERRVNLVSLRDGIDLNTTAGRLIANVLASVAQYETEVRAERVLAGQAAARAAGKTWGGSQKGRRIKVTDEQLAVIKRMKGEGSKISPIARATGLSRPTIYAYVASAEMLHKTSTE